MSRAAELAATLQEIDSLAVVAHDNPDPDCLASALALETIAEREGVDRTAIVYGGEISHQQNRAFVQVLEIDVREADGVDFGEYDSVAFVDHAGPASRVGADLEPTIVVDHHPGTEREAAFSDVRTGYGATATILVEYCLELSIPFSSRLASALLFALHRERLDFVREPTIREYEAALAVYPEADLEVLEGLYGAAFTPETIDAIGRAIASRERRGSALVASAGRTTETDALPQAADYLLNVEGVDTVLVYGVTDSTIRLSARSIDPRIHVGKAVERAYGDLGAVGGHHDMAGGRITLGLFAAEVDDDRLLALAGERVAGRFFAELGLA
ncbi:bifunctional oligoribonuclease/PAP phosphatase NrnA [Saliphagus sp. LR7]|uniref:DHH family phosphoesterase n=1 Tax=Saliphagus sp. LR7 TaxID=2282654 RepID=UPI000DF8136F|nr:bifunctional oligoribonuclease/PAP phosphatase NrnA [Saliphagus sp. LR7]